MTAAGISLTARQPGNLVSRQNSVIEMDIGDPSVEIVVLAPADLQGHVIGKVVIDGSKPIRMGNLTAVDEQPQLIVGADRCQMDPARG